MGQRKTGSQTVAAAQDAASPFRTLPEAAAYLRRSRETLRYWRQVGKGPRSLKIGRAVMYLQSELDAYIDQQASRTGGGDA